MVKTSTQLSVIVQLVIGVLTTRGVFFKVDAKHKILTQILIAETIVQYIELGFYTYFLKQFDNMPLSKMAYIRYYDWFFTTPTMLISTVMYFKYEEYIEQNKSETLDFFKILKEEQKLITDIVISNFGMLLFGYLGEKNKMDKKYAVSIGFIFFANTFNMIYKNYAVKSVAGKKIFNIILPIWGLYGVGACLNNTHKNNMFNVLDIFAKNFFSLFIYNKLESISKQNKNNS
jgi:bacteriorhodopsin